jgi:hypothetical protein
MNNKELLTYLKNKNIFILSPHFDDAILSAGMLMYSLQGQVKVTVINIFTKAHPGPYTLSAKQFLKAADYRNAVKMYAERSRDDIKALSLTGAKHLNLGFTDALFRKNAKSKFLGNFIAELDHIYPTYRWHIIKNINTNDTVVKDLRKKFERIIPGDSIVITPFGIGNHADHVITRLAAEKVFKNLIYYIDFPYNIRLDNSGKLPEGYCRVAFPIDLKIKTRLISTYTSQVNSLFEKGIVPEHQEKFFIKKGLTK